MEIYTAFGFTVLAVIFTAIQFFIDDFYKRGMMLPFGILFSVVSSYGWFQAFAYTGGVRVQVTNAFAWAYIGLALLFINAFQGFAMMIMWFRWRGSGGASRG